MLKLVISTTIIMIQANQVLLFFLKQKDPAKGVIDHDFVYSCSYNDYFQWLIDGFDSQEKTQLDVLTSKNAIFFL